MRQHSIFSYLDYKKYVADSLQSKKGHGHRSRLAEALNCQPAFISRVLNSDAHFSQEHALSIGKYLGHNEAENHYFMLLLLHARAGSKALEEYYLRQIVELRERRQKITERIRVQQSISAEEQMVYYSSWHYSAIHVLLMVPTLRTRAAIATHLNLPPQRVSECLEFLTRVGLAIQEGSVFRVGTQRIHLPSDSPMISKHHSNWRVKAIQSLDLASRENLHFSGPICISENDALKIKEMLLGLLEQLEPVIRDSAEEAVFCLGMDFFRL